MLKNYILIAWRNLKKNKVFSLINILGLTIGITVCMMIYLFIVKQYSYDSFHTKRDKIYRVMRDYWDNEPPVPYLSAPYATALLNDYPEQIEKAVRVMQSNGLITHDDKSFNEKKLLFADPGFFGMFDFPLKNGTAANALKDPSSVVLTEQTARRYFGTANPIGKVLTLDNEHQLKVTGITSVPDNSHLDFDMVLSLEMYYNEPWFNVWNNNNGFTYIQLAANTNPATLSRNFDGFMEKYMGTNMRASGKRVKLALTPLSKIYFEPHSSFDAVRHGEKTVVYIFMSIAILILVIACINFMNLSTIRAVERSKEVGLRKVMGALKHHLVGQFIGESMLLTAISCLLSVGAFYLLLPVYNSVLGDNLRLDWSAPAVYIYFGSIILLVGLLSGLYPAFILSAFSPIQALKGKLRLGKGGSIFRQALVVVQFSISVFLIVGTIIIMNQMKYVQTRSPGYNQDQVVLMRIDNNDVYNHRVAFERELERQPYVTAVSMMSGEPGGFFDAHTFEAEGQREVTKLRTVFTDLQYARTLGLKVIAGRDFSPAFKTDTMNSVLINRSAAAILGFTPDQAVGKWMRNTFRDSLRRQVVGVVEDFNFLSLKQKMDGLVITPGDDNRVFAIRMKPGSMSTALEGLKQQYASIAANYPMEYSFLDQQFGELYATDLRQQKVLTCFAVLAIFIACLGLFGLASFTANKRIREIGVRKVLGSSVPNIVLLLSRDLLKPVVMATLIGMPLAWYAMDSWLQDFAFRSAMHWWIFALAALLTFMIALVTVSGRAIRAAMANPVRSLKQD